MLSARPLQEHPLIQCSKKNKITTSINSSFKFPSHTTARHNIVIIVILKHFLLHNKTRNRLILVSASQSSAGQLEKLQDTYVHINMLLLCLEPVPLTTFPSHSTEVRKPCRERYKGVLRNKPHNTAYSLGHVQSSLVVLCTVFYRGEARAVMEGLGFLYRARQRADPRVWNEGKC